MKLKHLGFESLIHSFIMSAAAAGGTIRRPAGITVMAAVFFAICLASCSNNANDAGGRGTPDTTTVNIAELLVYQKNEGAGNSLLVYKPETKIYTVVITDETKGVLVADATGSGNTTIKIKYKAGGNSAFLEAMPSPKKNAVISEIPLPTSGNDTEIQFECGIGSWNGTPNDTITVKVVTPTPTLKNLSVRYTTEISDDSKELVKYTKGQNDYTVSAKKASAGTTDNKVTIKPVPEEGQEIKVTLKDSKPGAADKELPAAETYEVEPGEPGGYNKSVSIEVKYDGKSNIYSITFAPPMSADPVGFRLNSLEIRYAAGGDNKLNFATATHKYTLSPNTLTDGNVKQIYFTAASEPGSKITVTYTAAAEITYTGEGTSSVSGQANVPAAGGESRTLKFKAARDDGQNAEWSVTINAPSDVQTWKGTITYAGSENFSVQGLVVKDNSRNFQAGILTHGSDAKRADFQIEAPNTYTPKTFLVQLFDDQGRAMQSVPLEPSVSGAATPISINIPDKSKLTYIVSSANNFYDLLNDSANREVSYSLFNDIDLNDYTVNGVKALWNGPSGYSGHFYGNGYTIRGLDLIKTAGDTALFANLGDGAEIQDFTVEVRTPGVLNVTGASQFGGVVGYVNGKANLTNITVKGNLTYASVPGTASMGVSTFVGQTRDDAVLVIERCASEADIVMQNLPAGSQGILVGVFVGWTGGDVTIRKSYSLGKVSLNAGSARDLYASGIIGQIRNYTMTSTRPIKITIEECYSAGDMLAISTTNRAYAGGFVATTAFAANPKTITVKNSAALSTKIVARGGTDKGAHRIFGGNTNTANPPATCVFTNNIGRKNLVLGNDINAAPADVAGALDSIEGLGKTFDEIKRKSTWTNPPASGGLGWSEADWDFDGLTKTGADFYLPRLR
ncbi:MAG: hypothetical protein LBG72_03405 [Spirochaetaceae bacterium]|jgi:hypothetical protein|nr:hypothetical protein [Spirochaetaceae bacterium]